nr:uncharacterized protein CTRU02_13545 [Colletotrichum truncatum]KAF6783309.1 hypothetical protein CTRU02_13545 [Colletotrichum truncatum]
MTDRRMPQPNYESSQTKSRREGERPLELYKNSQAVFEHNTQPREGEHNLQNKLADMLRSEGWICIPPSINSAIARPENPERRVFEPCFNPENHSNPRASQQARQKPNQKNTAGGEMERVLTSTGNAMSINSLVETHTPVEGHQDNMTMQPMTNIRASRGRVCYGTQLTTGDQGHSLASVAERLATSSIPLKRQNFFAMAFNGHLVVFCTQPPEVNMKDLFLLGSIPLCRLRRWKRNYSSNSRFQGGRGIFAGTYMQPNEAEACCISVKAGADVEKALQSIKSEIEKRSPE